MPQLELPACRSAAKAADMDRTPEIPSIDFLGMHKAASLRMQARSTMRLSMLLDLF